MGRKTKKNTKVANASSQPQNHSKSPDEASTSTATVELSKSAKKEIAELITQLLEICSKPPESGAKEWEDYPEIHGLVQKIRKIQSVLTPPERNRADEFPRLTSWLSSNGVDTSTVEITEFPEYGFGLKVKKDFKEADKLLSIPRKLMLTVDSANKSPLGALVAEDKILQVMPNVTLAFHLLNEKLNPESFWKPYIDSLPSRYLTPLYWGPEELQLMKGSPVQGDAINQYRNIARQYAYFHRLLQKSSAVESLHLKKAFTFDNYRWAVSTVMTRQNQIPARDGSRATLGLIPLWDMCNHVNGVYTSDYNSETDACECFCLQDFAVDQQALIFYGPRSNGEFLVHNGFVYPDNEHDRMCLRLGMNKGESLFGLKSELLGKINLTPSRSFYLHKGKFPVDGDLLAFLRVFNMDEATLRDRYTGDSSPGPEELEQLKEEEKPVSSENEQKVWAFLQTRASILLRAYPCSLEDDEATLQQIDATDAAKMAAMLRVGERQILKNTIDYTEKKKNDSKSSS